MSIASRIAALAAASLLAGGFAVAQNTEEVQVKATRVPTTKTIGRSSTGIPIVEVSLSYGVSVAGLDLTSSAGVTELTKRVNEAAKAACEELGHQYPGATPSNAECAKTAAEKAMTQVHSLAASAQKSKLR